jgi:trehalose/maltose hydrolase-like predicted phosphorylase
MIEQFAGYFRLEDIDLGAYSARVVPMDVILGRERTQASQVVKQADVVALLALLPDLYDLPTQRRNYAYYEARCGHGSTLSTAMHALVAARLHELSAAERYVQATAEIDLSSLTISRAGGLLAFGGLWLAVVFGFAGFRPHHDKLVLDPVIPESWQTLSFRVQWRGRIIHFHIDHARRVLSTALERGDAVPVQVGGNRVVLKPGTGADVHYLAR